MDVALSKTYNTAIPSAPAPAAANILIFSAIAYLLFPNLPIEVSKQCASRSRMKQGIIFLKSPVLLGHSLNHFL
jgi:hypothetical protein